MTCTLDAAYLVRFTTRVGNKQSANAMFGYMRSCTQLELLAWLEIRLMQRLIRRVLTRQRSSLFIRVTVRCITGVSSLRNAQRMPYCRVDLLLPWNNDCGNQSNPRNPNLKHHMFALGTRVAQVLAKKFYGADPGFAVVRDWPQRAHCCNSPRCTHTCLAAPKSHANVAIPILVIESCTY